MLFKEEKKIQDQVNYFIFKSNLIYFLGTNNDSPNKNKAIKTMSLGREIK